MGDWPLWDGQLAAVSAADAATSRSTIVTGGASANTKGSWTELSASTPYPAFALLVQVTQGSNTAASDLLIDIGIGGSGSETVIVSNLLVSNGTSLWTTRMTPLHLPLGIPAGTRLAARCQSTSASGPCRVQVTLASGGWNAPSPLAVMTAYGVNTADSGATSIDPGGTINTKGSWVQLTASTTRPIRALVLGLGNQSNASRSIATWLLDLGTGTPGSERIILADQHLNAATNDDLVGPAHIGPIPVYLPAGSRIAARTQCDILDATDRLLDVAVYGLD